MQKNTSEKSPSSLVHQPKREGRPGRLAASESSRITKRITALSVAIGVVLILFKLLVFRASGSVGILSSLVHSGLDFVAALSSFIAVRYAARSPDQNYRFGRGKAEGFSAVLQVCLIILAAAHLIEEAVDRVGHPQHLDNQGYAIAVMIFAIGLTFWLLIAQTWAIRATGSLAVKGDRAHYIADMSANIAVIIGILIASNTNLVKADALVGVGIAIWLLFTAYNIAGLAWAQLMDQELPDQERNLITKLALKDAKIGAVHNLRTRAAGPYVHIQMQLDLDDTLSLAQSHDIVMAAEQRLMAVYPAADILIHPHPAGCHEFHGNSIFHLDPCHGDHADHSNPITVPSHANKS